MRIQRMRHRVLQFLLWNRPGFAALRLWKRLNRRVEGLLFNNSFGESNGEGWLVTQIGTSAVVFDVGFHRGHYTSEVLSAAPNATVYAFEPARSMQKYYQEGYSNDQRIKYYTIALSDNEGSVEFYDYASGNNSLSLRADESALKDTYTVEVRRIDNLCRDEGVCHIDLLKIDAEGHDLHILRGAERMLLEQRIGIFQIEYGDGWIGSRVYLKDLYDYMDDKPYKLYRLFNGFLVPYKYTTTEERFDLGRMIVGVAHGRGDKIRIRDYALS